MGFFGHLYDSFDDKKLSERFTLHGLTFNNKPVSLFRCLISGGEIHLPGGRSCKISSVSGIVGGHFRSLDEIAFKEIRVQLKGLVEWVCFSGIKLKFEENPRSVSATIRAPRQARMA